MSGVLAALHSVECIGKSCSDVPWKGPNRMRVVPIKSHWPLEGNRCGWEDSAHRDQSLSHLPGCILSNSPKFKSTECFLHQGFSLDQGHSKDILMMTAAGCLSKGIDGSRRRACPVMTAGPEREERHLTYHDFKVSAEKQQRWKVVHVW